jgi:hypothetical protein
MVRSVVLACVSIAGPPKPITVPAVSTPIWFPLMVMFRP